jgi:hypothetical protein
VQTFCGIILPKSEIYNGWFLRLRTVSVELKKAPNMMLGGGRSAMSRVV